MRYGVRTLLKTPGFALAGVVILGLGIGVNSAIFTVVNAVVLKPLPFAEAGSHHAAVADAAAVPVHRRRPSRSRRRTSSTGKSRTRSFERMAIYRSGRMTLTGQGEPDAVIALRGSADFLPILGMSPTLGRGFTQGRRSRRRADDGAAERRRSSSRASAATRRSSARPSRSTACRTP